MLTEKICLAPYAKDKENMVTADASRPGLGITLYQKQDSGDIISLAFGSRYLNDTEKKIRSANMTIKISIISLWEESIFLYGPPSTRTVKERNRSNINIAQY